MRSRPITSGVKEPKSSPPRNIEVKKVGFGLVVVNPDPCTDPCPRKLGSRKFGSMGYFSSYKWGILGFKSTDPNL